MKKNIILLSIALFLFLILSCQKSGNSTIVEIAAVGSYSGELAPYGIPTKRAVEFVFDDIEDVSINFQDDQCDPNIAANVASNIIGTKAVAVIGHICSGATEAALNVYKQTGLVSISPTATNPALTGSGKYTSIFFRTIASDDAQSEVQVDFLINNLKVKKVGIIHDKADYGKSIASYTKQKLENQDVKIVFFEGITIGAADYSSIVNKVASTELDAIVFGGYSPEASKVIIQLTRRGVFVPFVSGDGIKDDSFLQLISEVGDKSEIYATGTRDNTTNKKYKEAKQQHIDEYGEEPGAFFYEGYSAALVVKEAIMTLRKNNTAITLESFKEYMGRENSFDTPVGLISFDSTGNPIGSGFSIYKVQNGEYIEL